MKELRDASRVVLPLLADDITAKILPKLETWDGEPYAVTLQRKVEAHRERVLGRTLE